MLAHRAFFIFVFLLAACGGDRPADAPSTDSALTTIAAIQGRGAASPVAGRTVTVNAVVSGDFQDDDANRDSRLGGFYLSSRHADDDPRTSEGIFVFDRNAAGPDVQVGDVVEVTGKVSERFGETQLTATAVKRLGRAEVLTTNLRLPAAMVASNSDGLPIADLESWEGMRVFLSGPLYVQDLRGLERFGELLLSTEPREFQFTATNRPDPAGLHEHVARIAARSVLLDDGRADQNAQPVRYWSVDGIASRAPRVGDAVAVEGVLRYSRGSGSNGFEGWRLMPVAPPQFDARNPRPERPDVGGNVVVASFNVLNYFSATDNGENRCGPEGADGCRGADNAGEFARQRAKIAAAIVGLDADVVGIMELENNPLNSIADLVDAINERNAGWSYIDTGVIGTDAIRVAILYRVSAVSPQGQYAILDGRVDPRFNDRRNRPVLAQTFRAHDNGGRFTVAVNHLKSKGSPCDDEGDPDRGDGQGNCNITRTTAAGALADWLQGDPTGSGDPDALIIGDLNAYQREDPLVTLQKAGYVLLEDRQGAGTGWSFVFRGQSGSLDHALASKSLAGQVSGVAEWHINADEAPLHDYNLEFDRDPSLFRAASPWRASDHDPLLIGLTLQP